MKYFLPEHNNKVNKYFCVYVDVCTRVCVFVCEFVIIHIELKLQRI